METPDDATLKALHSILRKAREELVRQTAGEDSELFRDLFKYEESEPMRRLSFEKYVLHWINWHWVLHQRHSEDHLTEGNSKNEAFASVFIRLVKKLGVESRAAQRPLSELLKSLLQEKLELTQGLLEAGERADEMIQRLQYQHEKDKRIFERELRNLQDKKSNL